MPLKSIIALLQFTTILPLGKPVDITCFARHSYIYPVAGYVIGGIAAIVIAGIGVIPIAAALAIACVLFLSGGNHFDGLLDFGDGLMAHGSREIRVRALTDRQVGTGGIMFAVTFTLICYSGLLASPFPVWAIIVAEVGAKFSMALLTAWGTPFRDGIHSFLYRNARPYYPVLAGILCIPLIFVPISITGITAAGIAMILTPLILLLVAKHLFGGINGDVVGASNEITRAVILAVLAVIPL